MLPRSYVPATGLAPRLASKPLPFDLPLIEVGLLWHRRHEQDATLMTLHGCGPEIGERLVAKRSE